ncbi:MAG: hypothetical protein JXJ04_05340 [Spirochaetales bacterium]|nr:hypothetical protein [Spirochaetales bacterium]
MRKLIILTVLLCFLSFFIISCGVSGPAGNYLSHLNKVYSIIRTHPENAAEAAQKAADYVEKNREQISESITLMRQMSAKETEKIYQSVYKDIQGLIRYIQTHTTEEYPLGAQESLISALQVFSF